MENQQRSGNLVRLKSLVAVPICAALLCAPILAFSKTYGWIDVLLAKDLPKPREQRPDTLPRNLYMLRFIAGVTDDIKYPAEAGRDKFEGHAIATFTVANYKVKNIKIIMSALARGKGYGIPEEITRALQNRPQPVNIQPGKYALPFYFWLGKVIGPHKGGNYTRDKDGKIIEFKGIAKGYTFLDEVMIAPPNVNGIPHL